jgi:hypothetical protein
VGPRTGLDRRGKSRPPPGFDPWTVQPVAQSLYRLSYLAHSSSSSSRKKNDKTAPLQAWSGPEGSRKLRFPDFLTTAQDGGKVVSLTHRPP